VPVALAVLAVVVEGVGLVGVDVPLVRSRDVRRQRRARERMVVASGVAVSVEAVGALGADDLERVAPARVAQRAHRVFLRVRIEVAEDQDALAVDAGAVGSEPGDEFLRRFAPGLVPAALAVAGVAVAVALGLAATALGLEVVG